MHWSRSAEPSPLHVCIHVFCMAHCVCLFNIKTTYHAPEQDSIIMLSSELVGVGGRHLAGYIYHYDKLKRVIYLN